MDRTQKFLRAALFALLLCRSLAFSDNANNGVYGGYVGSDRWFSEMRKTAANQAMLRSLGRSKNPEKIPPDYIEFAGVIVFPDGNPFPKGQLPDLVIRCQDSEADPVERAPFIGKDNSFYTVFKKGESYDISWKYYFGSEEKFSAVKISPEGPAKRKQALEYRPAPTTQEQTTPRKPTPAPASEEQQTPPPGYDQFDLSGFPKTPSNFEEMSILEAVQYADSPALKAQAHAKLSAYYQTKGDLDKAQAESAKAQYWKDRIP